MHRSVLQNKKYISFHEENTVEVIALGRLQEGIDAEDQKAETYTAKDDQGNDVEYLVEFPGMTVKDMLDLSRSKAGSYNNTGRIPYTCVVNPYTLEEMESWSGGQSAKTIMESVKAHKKELEDQYGPSTSRKVLNKMREEAADVRASLAEGDHWKALTSTEKLAKSAEKYGPGVQKLVSDLQGEVLGATGKRLDELEAMLGGEDAAKAEREIKKLARALRGTALEERAAALEEKAKGGE